MTEQPKPPLDIAKLVAENMPKIAEYYVKYSWLARVVGLQIPPEVDFFMKKIAKGETITQEEVDQLKALGEKPQIGEPVLTKRLAEEAWGLHYGPQGLGTREIAEIFTKEGNPCSHSTVARWINMIDMEKQYSKALKLRAIAKYIIIAIAWFISLLLVKWYL